MASVYVVPWYGSPTFDCASTWPWVFISRGRYGPLGRTISTYFGSTIGIDQFTLFDRWMITTGSINACVCGREPYRPGDINTRKWMEPVDMVYAAVKARRARALTAAVDHIDWAHPFPGNIYEGISHGRSLKFRRGVRKTPIFINEGILYVHL